MDYRINFLNSEGRVTERADHTAETDSAILAYVRSLKEASAIEIWSGQRKVAHLDPRR